MELTVGKFLRFIITLIFIGLIGWILYSLSNIISIIIIAALVSYILDPIASYLEARGLKRTSATATIFLVFFLTFGIIGCLLLPGLFSEISSLQKDLGAGDSTNLVKSIEDIITANLAFINVDNIDIHSKINDLFTTLTDHLLAILGNIVSIIPVIVIVPFIVFFLLKDGREMKKLFIYYVPNRYFEMTLNVIHKIDQQLGGYLRGQFIEAFVVGVLAVIALWLLGIQYFIVIGVFAGLANLIPYIGPVAGAIPAIVITFLNGGDSTTIFYIIIAFAIVQLIDNVLLQPLVLSKSVNLHPLIIVFAVLIGGQFFGILGMVLAVPTAGMIKVTSRELYDGIRKFNVL